MSAIHPDELFMKRCIALAYNGIKTTKSNPMVGAVLVYQNRVIGEGFHLQYGGAHAEINAIQAVLPHDRQYIPHSTLYVTLEPCVHTGKTPPCVERIISEKIPKVIIGCLDPNPMVSGKGISKLRTHGVQVIENVAYTECKKLIRKFEANLKKIPFITLKWAQSADFFISKPGEQTWLSNAAAKVWAHQLRSRFDAILVGKTTVDIDNPMLNVRYHLGDSPIRIILDTHLQANPQAIVMTDEMPTFIYNQEKNATIGNKQYIQVENTRDLPQILKSIFQLGITSILVEGGSQILASFIQYGLWHEAKIIKTDKILRDGVPAPALSGTLEEKINIMDDEILCIANPNAASND